MKVLFHAVWNLEISNRSFWVDRGFVLIFSDSVKSGAPLVVSACYPELMGLRARARGVPTACNCARLSMSARFCKSYGPGAKFRLNTGGDGSAVAEAMAIFGIDQSVAT